MSDGCPSNTQSELAVLLSVSPQAVSRWENGQAFPDITLLPLLAKYLNVSIDELMGLEASKGQLFTTFALLLF